MLWLVFGLIPGPEQFVHVLLAILVVLSAVRFPYARLSGIAFHVLAGLALLLYPGLIHSPFVSPFERQRTLITSSSKIFLPVLQIPGLIIENNRKLRKACSSQILENLYLFEEVGCLGFWAFRLAALLLAAFRRGLPFRICLVQLQVPSRPASRRTSHLLCESHCRLGPLVQRYIFIRRYIC